MHDQLPGFPTSRPRRLRYNPLVRDLVRETELSPNDLILPLFVKPGKGLRQEIASSLRRLRLDWRQ